MSSISQAFARLQQERTRGLVAYLTAGFPAPEQTVDLMLALERGGADIIELGVPFSDPIADGPMIQKASDQALRAGTTLPRVLELLSEFRSRSELPVLVFSYLNPILRYGFERFAATAAKAGASGALLTDLNIENAAPYIAEMAKHHLDTVFLASQTTSDERLRQICQSCRGFVYLVSRAGVTGEQASLSPEAIRLVERARRATRLPLAVGFGLSKPEHMRALAPHADAAVVGSAFVRLIDEHRGDTTLGDTLAAFAAELKGALAIGNGDRSARS